MRRQLPSSILALALAVRGAPAALSGGGDALAPADVDLQPARNFSVYSAPIDTRFGQTIIRDFDPATPDALSKEVVARYADGSGLRMAIAFLTYDIVRRSADGTETSVPLYEMYNHHAHVALQSSTGEATSFSMLLDKRRTPETFLAPVRRLVHFAPATWQLHDVHLINTRRPRSSADAAHTQAFSRLSQCPCTAQRQVDAEACTIDGVQPDWVNETKSPCAEAVRGFRGGQACCRDGMFVIDTSLECARADCTDLPLERVFFKVTIGYEDAQEDTREPILRASLDWWEHVDWTHGEEFDVPQCAVGSRRGQCVHTVDEVGWLAFTEYANITSYDGYVEVVMIQPHVHASVISIALVGASPDNRDNRTYCDMSRANGRLVYGDGAEAGNEEGYLVGYVNCEWTADEPLLVDPSLPMRIVVEYDARQQQLGVMAKMELIAIGVRDKDGVRL